MAASKFRFESTIPSKFKVKKLVSTNQVLWSNKKLNKKFQLGLDMRNCREFV